MFVNIYFSECSLFILGKEDYEEIKTCLSATFEQVSELQMNGLTISGIHYSVTWQVDFLMFTDRLHPKVSEVLQPHS